MEPNAASTDEHSRERAMDAIVGSLGAFHACPDGDFAIAFAQSVHDGATADETSCLVGTKLKESLPADFASAVIAGFRRALGHRDTVRFLVSSSGRFASVTAIARDRREILAVIDDAVEPHLTQEGLMLKLATLREREVEMQRLLAREQAALEEQVRARRETEDALRAREVFLAVAAHELRTPLTPMRLQVDATLRELEADGNNERFARKMRVIERQTRRLETIVANLLDASQLASGHLDLHAEPLAVADIVAAVARRLDVDARASGSTFDVTVDPSVVVVADRARLDQVLTNLVGNALRFGTGKPIQITATHEGNRARIAVRDFGIGITEQDQKRIFDRFERAASERHYGGLGLGLWVTKQLVVALGGSIEVESRTSCGSTFTVWLPHAAKGGGT